MGGQVEKLYDVIPENGMQWSALRSKWVIEQNCFVECGNIHMIRVHTLNFVFLKILLKVHQPKLDAKYECECHNWWEVWVLQLKAISWHYLVIFWVGIREWVLSNLWGDTVKLSWCFILPWCLYLSSACFGFPQLGLWRLCEYWIFYRSHAVILFGHSHPVYCGSVFLKHVF